MNKAFSSVQEGLIIDRYLKGGNITEIAEEYQVHSETVRNVLVRNNVPRKRFGIIPVQVGEQIIADYLQGGTLSKLEDKYAYSNSTIFVFLKRNKVSRPPIRCCKLPLDQEKEVLDKYDSGMSSMKLSEMYDVKPTTITKILKRNNVRIKGTTGYRTCTLDETVFDQINERSAYWAGFLMADGVVTSQSPPRLGLMLSRVDEQHIYKFRSFLRSTHKVNRVTCTLNAKEFLCSGLLISSRKLAESLGKFGVVPRKSHIARLIGLDANRHTFRGLVDGDGYISFRSIKYNRYPSIGLVGSFDIVNQFSVYVKGIFPEIDLRVRKKSSIYTVGAVGMKALKIIKHLYENCDSDAVLNRKKVLADEIVSGKIPLIGL
jgi:Mor family transcriptional regulator